jgi:hypothetical protein
MLGDDGTIVLLRHDEPEEILTHLIVGVRRWVGDGHFRRYAGSIVAGWYLCTGLLNGHSGQRCERCTKRKHNF